MGEKLGKELEKAVTEDTSNYNLTYKGYKMVISKATGKVAIADDNTENTNKIKWIYEENADGNIEITGMDLSEYGDSYVCNELEYSSSFNLGIDIIEVPSQINGKKVVKIDFSKNITVPANYPFMGGELKIIDIKTIKFGDTIEEISMIFSGYSVLFTDLEEIILPQNLKIIGSTFQGSNLKTVDVPDGVTSIESFAFGSCVALTSINIPNSVTSIGSNAFYGTNNLTLNFNNGKNDSLVIPSNKWGASKITINGEEYNP